MESPGTSELVPDPADARQLVPDWYLTQEKRMYLFGIPMPPTANHLYATVNGRRVTSSGLKRFRKDVDTWALKKAQELIKVRAMTAALKKGEALRVEATFWFKRESVLTLKGKPKKNDISNRVKAIHDKVAELILVDDCLFWETEERKVVIANDSQYEWVDLNFSVIDLPR